jgi:hypothetical protein
LSDQYGSRTWSVFFVQLIVVSDGHGAGESVVNLKIFSGILCSAASMLSSKLVKGATLKVYLGLPHGMCSTNKDQITADLLAFLGPQRASGCVNQKPGLSGREAGIVATK